MTDKEKFSSTWFYSSVDVSKEKVTGLLGGVKEKTSVNSRQVDVADFSSRLANAYNEMDARGYDVVNVVPIQMGTTESCTQRNGTYVGDAAFSITRGAVVIGKLKENS